MRKIKLTLSYDGTAYAGWQLQPNARTVQGEVERALGKMAGEVISVIAASRTDAGVHALGQVVHFSTHSAIACDAMRAGLNSILPRDIAAKDLCDAPDGFHARRDAKSKRYIYRILASRDRAPLMRERCWQIPTKPDLAAMREAAGFLVGERDFTSFKASGCASRHAVRRLEKLEVSARMLGPGETEGEGELIELTAEGNGFVRHMVRNIVGTLVDVGLGRIAPASVSRIAEALDRRQAGRCAPACGLYLAKIFYGSMTI